MRFGSGVMPLTWASVICLAFSTQAAAGSEERTTLRVDAAYAGELFQALAGLRTGTRYLDRIDFGISMDGGRLAGLSGLTAYCGLVHGNGESISDLSGTRQSLSGIEGTSTTRVPELWLEQSFGSLRQSLRIGLYDVGSEFARIDSADLFFNQSQTMTPEFSGSGVHGPSTAPATGLGLRYSAQGRAWSGRLAVLDGDPGAGEEMGGVHLSQGEGALIVTEMDYVTRLGQRFGSGYWRYTARFADLRSTDLAPLSARRDNAGVYGFIESPVRAWLSGDGLRWSARFGAAAPRTNEIARSYGTGLTYSLASRQPVIFGVAAGVAELGSPASFARSHQHVRTASREWSYEVSAGWQVAEFAMLKANVQHIVHPGMDPEITSTWLLGFRFEVSRQWSW